MGARSVDDKASDTLVVDSGEGFWTGSSTLPHLHHLIPVPLVNACRLTEPMAGTDIRYVNPSRTLATVGSPGLVRSPGSGPSSASRSVTLSRASPASIRSRFDCYGSRTRARHEFGPARGRPRESQQAA